jgi:hypothetical protein
MNSDLLSENDVGTLDELISEIEDNTYPLFQ